MTESSIALITKQTRRESHELRIIQAARKDPRVFGELYQLYVQQVFRYLYSRLGNVHDAEDITAQTFLVAFESFDRFRQDGHFSSWLFTIARNKAMDHFRQRKNSTTMDVIESIPVEYDPLAGVIQSEQAAAAQTTLRIMYPGFDFTCAGPGLWYSNLVLPPGMATEKADQLILDAMSSSIYGPWLINGSVP
jgi:RNA polymerase sigma-70 factor (ECF subfamily)